MANPVTCSCGNLLQIEGEVAKCPQCGRETSRSPRVSLTLLLSLGLGLWSACLGVLLVATLPAGPVFLGLLCLAVGAGLPAMLWGARGLLNVRRRPGRCKEMGVAGAGLGTGLVGASLAVTSFVLAGQQVREAAERAD